MIKSFSVFIKTVEIHTIAQKFFLVCNFLKNNQFWQISLIALFYVLPKLGMIFIQILRTPLEISQAMKKNPDQFSESLYR